MCVEARIFRQLHQVSKVIQLIEVTGKTIIMTISSKLAVVYGDSLSLLSLKYSFYKLENNSHHFFDLITEACPNLNQTFKTALHTLVRYKKYVTNAIQLPYSNAKLEATNKLIKDIKRNAFGFRNFENFKTRILIAFNIVKEKTNFVSSRA